MIGLDTNVLVRYIMQDDPAQSAAAGRLIESLTVENPGYVPLLVLVEIGWVLSSKFELGRDEVAQVVEGLLRTRGLVIENAEVAWRALRLFQRSKADFADGLIAQACAAAGCAETMTFDRGAAKHADMRLVSV